MDREIGWSVSVNWAYSQPFEGVYCADDVVGYFEISNLASNSNSKIFKRRSSGCAGRTRAASG